MLVASDFTQILNCPQTCEYCYFCQKFSEIKRSSSVRVEWCTVIEIVLRERVCEELKWGCEQVVKKLSIELPHQQFRIGE